MSTPTLRKGITARLRTELESMPPGAKLPSENQLATLHGVSRDTVRNAYEVLENEGLVVARPGRPRIKRDTRPALFDLSAVERSTTGDDTWAAGVRSQGREPSQRLRVEILAGPRWATELLGLSVGAELVVRRRWRLVDGELCNTADTYFPEELVRGTAICRPSEVLPGTYRVMQDLGCPWVDPPEDLIVPRSLSEPEREMFGAAAGLPAVEVTRVRRSVGGVATAVTRILLPGGRNTLVYNPRNSMEEES